MRAAERCRQADAVINSAFDLAAFLVVVPGDQLHAGDLRAGAEIFIHLAESIQPGLAAVLVHDAILAPGGQSIVEALKVGGEAVLRRIFQIGGVKVIQVGLRPVVGIGGVNGDPGIAAAGGGVSESAGVAKDEQRIARNGRSNQRPVKRAVAVRIEEHDHRPAVDAQISG